MRTLIRIIQWLLLLGCASLTQAEVTLAIIANRDVPLESITAEQATQIFLKQQQNWPNGRPAQPIDLREGSALRSDFYMRVSGRSQTQLRAYWARQTFTGMALPPREALSSEEVARWVANTPGAIGYVLPKDVEGNVKVLLSTTH
jgi:ABC-type phosphate transport system substrate-binding protein